MSGSPIAILRSLPRTARLLIFGTFINRAGTFIIPFLAIVLKRDFGLSEERFKVLFAAFGLGTLVSILIGGWLADKLGRRQTLFTSLIGGGLIAIAMGFVNRYEILAPLLLLYGFIGELYRPAASAIIGDVLPSERRPAGFAALRLAVNLGFGVGTFFGGYLADAGHRFVFWGDGITTVLFGVLAMLLIPETQSAEDRAAPAPPGGGILRDGVFMALMFCSLLFVLIFFNHILTFPITVVKAGYSAKVYGHLIALNCLLVGTLELSIIEWLRPRYRRLRLAAVGMLLTGIGFAIIGAGQHWGWWTLAVLVWTAGEIFESPQIMAFIADWAPPSMRGRYIGLFQATWSLGITLCPLIFLPLHAKLPEHLFWPLMLPFTLPAILILLRLDKTADRPELLRGTA